MNSTIEQLRQRGSIEGLELSEYSKKDIGELIKLLEHKEAYIRSAATKAISIKCDMNDVTIAKMILERLVQEKKLYTRIEMGTALEAGGELTAQEMINYIGKIGK